MQVAALVCVFDMRSRSKSLLVTDGSNFQIVGMFLSLLLNGMNELTYLPYFTLLPGCVVEEQATNLGCALGPFFNFFSQGSKQEERYPRRVCSGRKMYRLLLRNSEYEIDLISNA